MWDKGNGEYAAGTAFKYLHGIVTAKHCITDVNNLMVKGFTAEDLRNSNVYVHQNDGVDIAFIELGSMLNGDIYYEEGKILEEVLVMGYPKIPAFTDMITVEKTSIASKAEARHTTTTGSVVSFGKRYLMNCEMMLITAKVSGGNSGGPVINDKGSLVGITSCHTDGEGEYDNLGYGVVSPGKYLMDIVSIDGKRKEVSLSKDFFRDWSW